MPTSATSPARQVAPTGNWHNKPIEEVLAAFGSSAESGLSQDEASSRLTSHGPNVIAAEPSPTVWSVALLQGSRTR